MMTIDSSSDIVGLKATGRVGVQFYVSYMILYGYIWKPTILERLKIDQTLSMLKSEHYP